MGQEISQQQQQHHNQNHNHNHNLNLSQNLKRAQPHRKNYKDPIYTPASNLSTSSSSNSTDDYDANYRLRHKYNLTKQTYERSKILASNSTNRTSTQSDSDSHYAKINSNNNINIGNSNNKFLQRSSSSSQSSDSGIYNSSCHCSSLSSLSSSAVSSSSTSSSSGCPSSLVSSKSSRSLDKQKQYLSHHLYIKSYLDILEEDERARAHFKSARPGGIRNYTPKILAGGSDTSATKSTLSTSAPAASFGLYRNPKQRGVASSSSSATTAATAVVSGRNYQEDPWI